MMQATGCARRRIYFLLMGHKRGTHNRVIKGSRWTGLFKDAVFSFCTVLKMV